MKKALAIASVCIISGIASAQSTNKIFSEAIPIKSDTDQLMAMVTPEGKVILSQGTKYDDVVDILIIRIIKQNIEAQTQIQKLNNVIQNATERASVTSQKAAEIFQIWNAQQKEEPKKVEPVKIKTKPEVKKVEPIVKKDEPKKKSWFSF